MIKKWPLLTTVVCLTLVTSACSESASTVETEKTAISVEVATAKNESLDAISSLTGTLLPYEETTVSFEVGGNIEKMNADIGDIIQNGTTLTSLKSTDYDLQVKQADNAIRQAEAGLNSSDSAIKAADASVSSSDESIKSSQANIKAANARINSAQASLDSVNKGARQQEKDQAKIAVNRAKEAYNKLKTDANRIQGLYDEGLASKKEVEDMNLQVANAQKDVTSAEKSLSLIEEGATKEQQNQAKAGVQEAEAGKEQAVAGVGQSKAAKGQALSAKEQAIAAKGQAEAVLEQAVIAKEQAENTRSKTNLKSPIAGVVLDKLASEGQHISPGDAIYKLGQTDQLKVLLPVPDRDIKEWKVGDEVSVTLYDKDKTGKVSKIYPQTNANTGTISVEVVIPNNNLEWVPGQVVKANRVTSDNKGILVPIEAVMSSGSEPYVFKNVKGKAVKTKVTTGNLVDNKIHIVSGLKAGDKVVTRGGELLLDGDLLETGGGKK